jgi:hypothetical protein
MGGLVSNPVSEAEAEQGDSMLPTSMVKDVDAVVIEIVSTSRRKYSFEFKMESKDRNYNSISEFQKLMLDNGMKNDLELGYVNVSLSANPNKKLSTDISKVPLNRRALDTLFVALSSSSTSRYMANVRPAGLALDLHIILKPADEIHVLGLLYRLFMQYNLFVFPAAGLHDNSVNSDVLVDLHCAYKAGTHRGSDLFASENAREVNETNKLLKELSVHKKNRQSKFQQNKADEESDEEQETPKVVERVPRDPEEI